MNQVKLIIIGITDDIDATVILNHGYLPQIDIVPDNTIEAARDRLFEEITGFTANPLWVKFQLLDVMAIKSDIHICYSCLIANNIELGDNYQFTALAATDYLDSVDKKLIKEACLRQYY